MSGDRPPARVRVTASDVRRPRTTTRSIPVSGAGSHEADAVFTRGLVRAQLRLALASLLGFVVVAGALTGVLFLLPAAGDPLVFGVPLSWLMHAYGFYPIILVFAIVYARGASRNERRYRVLVEPEHDT